MLKHLAGKEKEATIMIFGNTRTLRVTTNESFLFTIWVHTKLLSNFTLTTFYQLKKSFNTGEVVAGVYLIHFKFSNNYYTVLEENWLIALRI